MMDIINGMKTYSCVIILIVSAGIYAVGGITIDTLKGIYAVVGPLAIAALKSAQNTAHAQVMDKVAQIAAVQQVASAQVAQVQGSVDAVHDKVEQVQKAQ